MRRNTKLTACLLPLALLAPPAMAGTDCHPLSLETCGLPFPSNHFAQPDATSPTGKRLQVSDNLLRQAVLDQLPAADGLTPEGIFNGDSGFSAASPVLFEFALDSQLAALPLHGGDLVQAYDLDSGERVPVRASISDYARNGNVSAPSQVLEVHPLSRWQFGHRILVLVSKELLPGNNQPPHFSEQLAATTGSNADYLNKVNNQLLQMGVSPAEVHSATVFTVRDRGEVDAPLRELVERTYNSSRSVRNLRVNYLPLSNGKVARVTGELRLDNYRTNNGTGVVDFSASPREQWASFRLTIPRAARQGGVPVVFYTHGLGGDKSMDALVADMNADLGMATYSVDFPNHGDRAEEDGGGVFANLSIDRLPVQIGMINQASIDFAAAQKTLQTELADLDVAGPPTWRYWTGQYADGVPDLDTSRIMMQGTSLGGVLGSTYAALSPQMDAAVFHVTGNGITSILSESILWNSAFSGLMPSAATGAEALLLRGAVQQELDHGDGINYVDLMREPSHGRNVRPLMIITGAGDTIVPNSSSVATALLADLPLVGNALYPMPGVRQQADYDPQGFGLRHYRPLVSYLGDLSDASSHGVFLRLSAVRDQKDWISRFFLQE
ncbi:MAG: hypothetical protein EA349_14130 [Halomonadaceae bacterium]|nr:MAG: hypothetical protein EA349_14130 [Halomonadaceae bacterium]